MEFQESEWQGMNDIETTDIDIPDEIDSQSQVSPFSKFTC
jgi:hypothetical protein